MAKVEPAIRDLIEVLTVDPEAIKLTERDGCASIPLPSVDTGKLKGSKRDSYIEGFKAAWVEFAAKIRERS